MQKLQHELDEAMPDRRVVPDIALLHKLPYLTAFMKEGQCLLDICLRSLAHDEFHRFESIWCRSAFARTCCSQHVRGEGRGDIRIDGL